MVIKCRPSFSRSPTRRVWIFLLNRQRDTPSILLIQLVRGKCDLSPGKLVYLYFWYDLCKPMKPACWGLETAKNLSINDVGLYLQAFVTGGPPCEWKANQRQIKRSSISFPFHVLRTSQAREDLAKGHWWQLGEIMWSSRGFRTTFKDSFPCDLARLQMRIRRSKTEINSCFYHTNMYGYV